MLVCYSGDMIICRAIGDAEADMSAMLFHGNVISHVHGNKKSSKLILFPGHSVASQA